MYWTVHRRTGEILPPWQLGYFRIESHNFWRLGRYEGAPWCLNLILNLNNFKIPIFVIHWNIDKIISFAIDFHSTSKAI